MFAPFLQFAGHSGPSQAQFEAQAAAGLNAQLEYVNSTTVKFSSKSGSTISVITPNLNTIDVTTSGLTKAVSGSTSTLYYVYLDSTGLSFSTSATDTTYTNMKTLSGTKILVGYLGCSASNTIAGTHNVFSFWNEPQRTWTQSTTSFDSSQAIVQSGFILPTGKTATVGWAGTRAGSSYRYMIDSYCDGATTASVTNTAIGSQIGTGSVCGYTLTRTQSVAMSVGTSITASISNLNIYITGTFSISWSPGQPGIISASDSYSVSTGTITLTRPGS
jgi:hypothetical protein